jgi:hypothetical protein
MAVPPFQDFMRPLLELLARAKAPMNRSTTI